MEKAVVSFPYSSVITHAEDMKIGLLQSKLICASLCPPVLSCKVTVEVVIWVQSWICGRTLRTSFVYRIFRSRFRQIVCVKLL